MANENTVGLTDDLFSILTLIQNQRQTAGLRLEDTIASLESKSLSSSQTLEAMRNMFLARVSEGESTAMVIEGLIADSASRSLNKVEGVVSETSDATMALIYEFAAQMTGVASSQVSPENVSSLPDLSSHVAIGLSPSGIQIDMYITLQPSRPKGSRGYIIVAAHAADQRKTVWRDGSTEFNFDLEIDGCTVGDLLTQRVASTQAYSEFARLTEVMETYGGAITSEQLMLQASTLVSDEARSFVQSITTHARSITRDGFLSVLSGYLDKVTPDVDDSGVVLGARPETIVSSLANIAGTIITAVVSIAATVLVVCCKALGAALSVIISLINKVILRVKESTTFTAPEIEGHPSVYHIRDVLEEPIAVPASRLSNAIRAAAMERGVAEIVTPLATLLIYYNASDDSFSAQSHLNVFPLQNFDDFLTFKPGEPDTWGESFTLTQGVYTAYQCLWENSLTNVTNGSLNPDFHSFDYPSDAKRYDIPTCFAFAFARYSYLALRLAWRRYEDVYGPIYGFQFSPLTILDTSPVVDPAWLQSAGWSACFERMIEALSQIEDNADIGWWRQVVTGHRLKLLGSLDSEGNRIQIDPSTVMSDDEYLAFVLLCAAAGNAIRLAFAVRMGIQRGDRDYSDGVNLQKAFMGIKKVANYFGVLRGMVEYLAHPWSLYTGGVDDNASLAANTAPGAPQYNPDDLTMQYDVPNINLATVRNALIFTGVALGAVSVASMVWSLRVTKWKRSASVRNDANLEVAKAKLARDEITQDQYQQVLSQYNKTERKMNLIYGLVSGSSSDEIGAASSSGSITNTLKSVDTFIMDNSDTIVPALEEYGISIPERYIPDPATAEVPVTLDTVLQTIVGIPTSASGPDLLSEELDAVSDHSSSVPYVPTWRRVSRASTTEIKQFSQSLFT